MSKSKCDRHWFETPEQKLIRLLHTVSIPVAPPKEDKPQLDPDKECGDYCPKCGQKLNWEEKNDWNNNE